MTGDDEEGADSRPGWLDLRFHAWRWRRPWPGAPLAVGEIIRLASRADLMATTFSYSLAARIAAATIPVDPLAATVAAA